MNYINPLSFDETKLKYPSLAGDIQNMLFRFNSHIIPDSIKGIVYNIHIQNEIQHNPLCLSVNFDCHYTVENDTTSNLVSVYLWYNQGRLHREGFPAVIISKNFQNLYEEIWVNGVNPKLKLPDNPDSESKMSKSNCKECKNSFNTSTLNKYDGYCGRCSKKVSETTSSTPIQPVTEPKYSKKKIPERLRQEVWEKNIGDFKLQDSDITYMIENFDSFDTDKSTLHLGKYITDSNCTQIYRKYCKYESLSFYLQCALTNIQKESLLTHAKERLRRSDYETLERLYVREPELMIVRQEVLEQIRNDVPNFQ